MTTEQTTTAQNLMQAGIGFTNAALAKIAELVLREENPDLALRVQVLAGGCSGLRYQLYFDDQSTGDDQFMQFRDGVKVVVDKHSAPYLASAMVDYVDTIQKQGFTIDNPNAKGSCACGDSFN